MKKSWKKIQRMIKENHRHRKGFELALVQPPFILDQAMLEFVELIREPDSPHEMADVLGVLIHYCIKQGWDMEFIEDLLIEKLNIRFVKPTLMANLPSQEERNG